MSKWKVPVQSLIDHIKTAIDVDPWAKEMAEELLKEQPEIVRCKDCKYLEHLAWLDEKNGKECYVCRKHTFTGMRSPDWFCADAERGNE